LTSAPNGLLIRAKDLLEGALQRVALRFMTPIAKV
jgi:hypothetical protein